MAEVNKGSFWRNSYSCLPMCVLGDLHIGVVFAALGRENGG